MSTPKWSGSPPVPLPLPAAPEREWVLSEELQPGDAYREGAYVVFTAQYHLRRGSCCRSGCRHCPYRDAGPTASVNPL